MTLRNLCHKKMNDEFMPDSSTFEGISDNKFIQRSFDILNFSIK